MLKNTKKNINWLVEEFSSIDLIAAIESSNIKSSETKTTVEVEGNDVTFVSSRTENDEKGRPLKTVHLNEDGDVEEEYRYSYDKNTQKVQLLEQGRESSTWLNTYDEQNRLLRSEYQDLSDGSKDIETFEYDDQGRLIHISLEMEPVEEEDEDELEIGFKMEWDNNRLLSIVELYGEDEESRMDFSYDMGGHLIGVRKYIFAIDDDGKEMKELMDEQKPVYNEHGQLIKNTIHYYTTNARLEINYSYDEDGNVTKTTHDDYHGNKKMRSIEFTEDGQGNLLQSVEIYHDKAAKKTDVFSYVYF